MLCQRKTDPPYHLTGEAERWLSRGASLAQTLTFDCQHRLRRYFTSCTHTGGLTSQSGMVNGKLARIYPVAVKRPDGHSGSYRTPDLSNWSMKVYSVRERNQELEPGVSHGCPGKTNHPQMIGRKNKSTGVNMTPLTMLQGSFMPHRGCSAMLQGSFSTPVSAYFGKPRGQICPTPTLPPHTT